jgi:RNA polymerase sigma-70 factor (ECF subfamily)
VPLDAPTLADGPDPEQEAILADSVGLALLVVLDTLTPAERLAFVLHDMIALSFDEIAAILGRSTQAAKGGKGPRRSGRRRCRRGRRGSP